jgi:CRP/FNR family transcriptional regulator, cyclic AMP receptor protein
MTAESLFLNAPHHLSVAAGSAIYRQGEAGAHMYGVVSGAVELRKGNVVVARLGPGDVFGERALIDHSPRNLDAFSVEKTVLAEIDRKLFLFLVYETPTFALGIMEALGRRLRVYDELIAQSPGVLDD